MERLLEPYLRSLASTKFTSLLLQRDRVCSAKALSREAHQWLRAPARISSNGRSLNVNRARTVLAEHVIRPAR